MLYSTWGRHDGDAPNADCGYGTFLGMNRKTTAGYEHYAKVLQGSGGIEGGGLGVPTIIAPCGRAFELVYNSSESPAGLASNFSCLYHHSLTDGYTPGEQRCKLDAAGKGGHPSLLGTYLIACVFVATIHRQSPVGVAWAPLGISAPEQAFAQRVAHKAVFGADLASK